MNAEMFDQVLETFRVLLNSALSLIPGIVVGLVLTVLALLSAKAIELVARVLLTRLRLDRLVARVGVDQALHRVGLRQSLNVFLPRVLYFLVLFLFVRTAAEVLHLNAISEAIGSVLGYLPNVLGALLILLVGSAGAAFIGAQVTEMARDSGLDYARSLGRFVSGVILFVLGVMAIGQLRVDTEIVRLVVACVLVGLALAFGLSFGLGTRDVTRNIVAGYYARKVFETGRPIEIAGERGLLVAITPTQAVIRQDQRVVTVANRVLMDEIVKQDLPNPE